MAIFTAIGAFIFGAGTFLAGLTAFALQTVAGIGLSLIAQSLAGKSKSPEQVEQPYALQGTLQNGGDLARSILFGYSATAGSLVYQQTFGFVNDTPNAFFTQVIALGDFPVGELVEVWVSGEKVTVLWNEDPVSQGYPVQQYRKNGVDHLWVKFHDGTQTTADGFLQAIATTERPYQSTRVGLGVPYVIATALINEELFSGWPTYRFATDGAKLYDISKDTTAGGSGPQRWSDPSTWGGDGDSLPVVQVYNILRGISYGGAWLYGLQNLPAARLPAAHWIAQIGKCRALIAGPDGNEATYRAGGEIRVGTNIADTIEQFLTSCQGRLTESGGVYKVFVGQPGNPLVEFDDGTILSTEEQTFSPFFGLADTVNGITASYPNPLEGWNTKEAPPLYRADLEAEVGGRRLLADVSLDLVPYRGQVQRLMKSALQEAQRARRHTIVMPPDYWALEPGEVVQWSSTRNGYIDKHFRIDGVIDRANLDVIWDITEVDPSDYDWDQNADYRVPVDGPLTVVRPAPQPLVGWGAEGEVDEIGGKQRPCIRLIWDPTVKDDIDLVAYEVRRPASLVVVDAGATNFVERGSLLIWNGLFSNTAYEVRGRYVAYSGRAMLWSAWLAVTTPDAPYSDIIAGLEQLKDDIKNYLEEREAEFIDQFAQLDTYLRNVLALSADDVVDRKMLVSNFGRMRASFKQEVFLRTTQYEALAAEQTTVRAEITDLAADVQANAQTQQTFLAQLTALNGQVTTNAQAITQVQSFQQSLQNQITAAGTALNTLNQKVTTQGTTITSLSQNISAANASIASLNNKATASATAIGILQASTTSINGQITSIAKRTTLVEARTARGTGQGLFEIRSIARPAGVLVRLQFGARVTESGVSQFAGAYLDVTSTGSQWVFDATRFIITNGSGKFLPFIFEAGILKLAGAHIGKLRFDQLTSTNGKLFIRGYGSFADITLLN